jgi:hypothetical protein
MAEEMGRRFGGIYDRQQSASSVMLPLLPLLPLLLLLLPSRLQHLPAGTYG